MKEVVEMHREKIFSRLVPFLANVTSLSPSYWYGELRSPFGSLITPLTYKKEMEGKSIEQVFYCFRDFRLCFIEEYDVVSDNDLLLLELFEFIYYYIPQSEWHKALSRLAAKWINTK